MLVALAMSLATAAVEATGSGRPAARIELRGLVDGGSVGQATFAVRAGAMAGGTQPLPAGGAACGTPIWHDADTPTCRRWLVLTQLDLPPPASA
ncbi:MAG: hypothetical protein DYG93_04365 [Leptolyngbya sp. PLA2]|nr:hypothetical protein [Leptolyngbya sp. PL-A2]MCQ3940302.1 hypothetical protein [cyanobacterium CYA1]